MSAAPVIRRAPADQVRARLAEWLDGDAGLHGDAALDGEAAVGLVARGVHPSPDQFPERVGRIVLRPHQADAVVRLRRALARDGGALLADEVGLGKTYVAAALAREARRPVIVAPAALRPMWLRALELTGVRAELISYEMLSRRAAPPLSPDLLVLDEAHHARTPSARRYREIAALAMGARVLLLSATPLHNRRGDLSALLALFLGARAWSMGQAEVARYIIRRERDDLADAGDLPELAPVRWIEVGADQTAEGRLLDEILALPPPLQPSDGGDGGALLQYSLVRQWASSQGALIAALRRQMARALALRAALEAGRLPTRSELSAWAYADRTVQLAFPELVAGPAPEPRPLLEQLCTHEAALRSLLARLRHAPGPDARRAGRLRELRLQHPGEKIVVFSQFAHTVRALFRELRADAGIAALTARGGQVAGGDLTRAELLRRFAPRGSQAEEPPPAERIDLLLATDLLSEGVNLQDASVVVHLDLPWTAARLEQRVGRVRRLGAARPLTSVYALAPPAPAERLLRVEARLREKSGAAWRAVGGCGMLLPEFAVPRTEEGDEGGSQGDEGAQASLPRLREQLARLMRAWRSDRCPPESHAAVAAAVRSARPGAIALVEGAGPPLLVARLGSGPWSDDAAQLLHAARLAGGEERDVPDAAFRAAAASLEHWLRRREGGRLAGAASSAGDPVRREILRRVARVAGQSAFHRRAAVAGLVQRARSALAGVIGVGAEHALAELLGSPLSDEAWLGELCTLCDAGAAVRGRIEATGESANRLVALLLFAPGE